MARIFGYARVSTDEQDLALQLEALTAAGVAESDIFRDVVSGAQAERPGLQKLLETVQVGDTITVWRLDRLGRSVLHLADLAQELRSRGVEIRGLADGVNTATSAGRMLYGILSSLAEYEREMIKERIGAGMQAARKAGIHCGRPRKMTPAKAEEARRMLEHRPGRQVAAILGVSEATMYRALQRYPAAAD